MFDKYNVLLNIRCVFLHREKEFAESAVELLAFQWNHSNLEKFRNLDSMLKESNDQLPCHLVLTYKDSNDLNPKELVVAHVKIVSACGRSDGECAILYSLVVAPNMRGLGLGRILTENAENYVRSLNIAYVYLSTPDMALFYEHIGYRRCDPISSMKNSSKQLSVSQLSSLEGLFAKRLNVTAPCESNIWLRKRLIMEYDLYESFSYYELTNIIKEALYEIPTVKDLSCLFIETKWQQQVGPSCGVSAINMLNSVSHIEHISLLKDLVLCDCALNFGKEVDFPPKSCLEWALKLGISNDGELFCAHNLAYLAGKCYQIPLRVSNVTETTKCEIFFNILSGCPVIIPYDRNLNNHMPGFFQGLHAHWALVIGIVIPKLPLENICESPVHSEMLNEFYSFSLYKFSPKLFIRDIRQLFQENDWNSLWVVCTHGMSSQPFVCLLDTLIDSNKQLLHCKSNFFLSDSNLIHLRNKIVCTYM